MEIISCFSCAWFWCKALGQKLTMKVKDVARSTKKVGVEDPRRIIHSMKVGLAITIVSLFYYFDPLYEGLGVSAIWAVITVVLNCEFSVGATLSKSIIGGLATLVAATLGIGAHRLATFSGDKFEPILVGIFVFIIASIATFARFFPKIKTRYEYGCLLFILTVCSVSISGYRNEVADIARKRLSTFLIGGFVAVAICILIFPVWAGADLHNAVATNIEKLGTYLEGFGGKYFKKEGDGENKDNMVLLDGYKSILNSNSTVEALANFAKWEPRHGQFRYRHPWDQYMKIATFARECAHHIDALNGYLNSETQASSLIRRRTRELCIRSSLECSTLLKESVLAIKTWTLPSNIDLHIENAKLAAEKLENLQKLGLWHDMDILEIISATTIASLLLDVSTCSIKIAELVNELACLAKFKTNDDASMAEEKIMEKRELKPYINGPPHVINVE